MRKHRLALWAPAAALLGLASCTSQFITTDYDVNWSFLGQTEADVRTQFLRTEFVALGMECKEVSKERSYETCSINFGLGTDVGFGLRQNGAYSLVARTKDTVWAWNAGPNVSLNHVEMEKAVASILSGRAEFEAVRRFPDYDFSEPVE